MQCANTFKGNILRKIIVYSNTKEISSRIYTFTQAFKTKKPIQIQRKYLILGPNTISEIQNQGGHRNIPFATALPMKSITTGITLIKRRGIFK